MYFIINWDCAVSAFTEPFMSCSPLRQSAHWKIWCYIFMNE